MEAWGLMLLGGDLLDGMMAGKIPLSFVPLANGAKERSEGDVGKWVRSWWRDFKGKKPWGSMDLIEVTKDNLFDLHNVEGPRIWMPPPAAMETIMEVFN